MVILVYGLLVNYSLAGV